MPAGGQADQRRWFRQREDHFAPRSAAPGEQQPVASGYCRPFSFDISAAVNPGGRNQITILCNRKFINELGTGGLLGAPVVLYRDP